MTINQGRIKLKMLKHDKLKQQWFVATLYFLKKTICYVVIVYYAFEKKNVYYQEENWTFYIDKQ